MAITTSRARRTRMREDKLPLMAMARKTWDTAHGDTRRVWFSWQGRRYTSVMRGIVARDDSGAFVTVQASMVAAAKKVIGHGSGFRSRSVAVVSCAHGRAPSAFCRSGLSCLWACAAMKPLGAVVSATRKLADLGRWGT